VRLRPAPHSRSRIISYSLQVDPGEHFVNWMQDPMGNYQARLVFPGKTSEFKVTVDLVTEMAVYNPFDFFLEPWAENYPFDYAGSARARACALSGAGRAQGPLLADYVARIPRATMRTIDFLVEPEPATAAGHPLPDPHGAGRADARRDPGDGQRLVPRQRPGCWCRSCDTAAWPRGSSRAT
jgi:transglutaminase-like putative cysteine protease